MSAVRYSRSSLLFGAALCALSVAGLGALMTDIGPWYAELRKPPWQPPDMLFGPVWTAIFALAALSGFLALRNAPRHTRTTARILSLFAINGMLNILWSALFFTLHRPDWALVEVGLLWLSILLLMIATAPESKLASLLLLPYLLWVSFAAYLNYTIVKLNAPF